MGTFTMTLKIVGVLLVHEIVAILEAISTWFHVVESFIGETKFKYLTYPVKYLFNELGKLVKVNTSMKVQESVFHAFMKDNISYYVSRDYSLASIGHLKQRVSDRYFTETQLDGIDGNVYIHLGYKPVVVGGKELNVWELATLRMFGTALRFDAVLNGVKIWNYCHAGSMKKYGVMNGKVIILENMINDGFGFMLDTQGKYPAGSSVKLSTCFINAEGNLGINKGVMRVVTTYAEVLAFHKQNPELALRIWNALLSCKGMVIGSNEVKCLKDKDGIKLYNFNKQYDTVYGIKSCDYEKAFDCNLELSYQNAARSAHVLDPIMWARHMMKMIAGVRTRSDVLSYGHGPYNRVMDLFGLANKNISRRYQDLRSAIIRKAARVKVMGFRCYAALGEGLADDEMAMSSEQYDRFMRRKPDDTHVPFVKRDPDHGWAIRRMRIVIVEGLGRIVLLPASFFNASRGDMDGDLYSVFWGIPSGLPCHAVPKAPSFPMIMVPGTVTSEYDAQVIATKGKMIGYPDWFSTCLEESGYGEFARNFRWFALQAVIDQCKHGSTIDIEATIKCIKERAADKVALAKKAGKPFKAIASSPSRMYYLLNNKTPGEHFVDNKTAVFTPQLNAVISQLPLMLGNMWTWDNATESVRWNTIATAAKEMTGKHIPRKGYILDVLTVSPELAPTFEAYWAAERGEGAYSVCRDTFRAYLDGMKSKYKTMEYLRRMTWACAKIWGTGRFYLAIMLALTEKELIVAHTAVKSFVRGAGIQNKVNFLTNMSNVIKGVKIEDNNEAIDRLI